jgi:uncharacterized protein YdhG (YjbR/CyaY superfamily)
MLSFCPEVIEEKNRRKISLNLEVFFFDGERIIWRSRQEKKIKIDNDEFFRLIRTHSSVIFQNLSGCID